jgi:hypothetical protein
VAGFVGAKDPPFDRVIRETGINLYFDQQFITNMKVAVSLGAVARLVGIEGGVVSGVINLESSGVEASDWRPRHDEPYHEV